MTPRALRRLLLVLLFVMMAVARASAEDSLDSARQLYAAAAYDEALAMLDRLSGESDAAAPEVEQQRALCFLALNRPADAERSIAVVVQSNPLYMPDSSVSPRIRTAFQDVRSRLLPDIARQQFIRARDSFRNEQYARAAVELDAVLALTRGARPDDDSLADLGLLADGFRTLALAALKPAPPQTTAPDQDLSIERVFDSTVPGVQPPKIVKQDMPSWRSSMGAPPGFEGIVAVTIDEQGTVERVDIIRSLHAEYDRLLEAAARKWAYVPASHDGSPVKFRKLLRLSLQ